MAFAAVACRLSYVASRIAGCRSRRNSMLARCRAQTVRTGLTDCAHDRWQLPVATYVNASSRASLSWFHDPPRGCVNTHAQRTHRSPAEAGRHMTTALSQMPPGEGDA